MEPLPALATTRLTSPRSWRLHRTRLSPLARREARQGYLFIAPWIIGFLAFIVYPMFASLYYSFTNYDLLSAPRFVGLENYTFMFTKDPQFWQAMRNTLWIIAVGLPLEIAFAIGFPHEADRAFDCNRRDAGWRGRRENVDRGHADGLRRMSLDRPLGGSAHRRH